MMAVLASVLSRSVMVTIPVSYTTPLMVSAVTGGEIQPNDVRQEWIDAALDEVNRRSGFCFAPKDFSEELNGNGLATIFTSCFPLIEVFNIRVADEGIHPSGYVVNKRTGSITIRDGIFPDGFRNVVVTGIFGYRQVPSLVQKIATLLVAKTALSAKNGQLVDNESIGDFTQTRTFKKLNDELDRAWEALGRRFPIDFV